MQHIHNTVITINCTLNGKNLSITYNPTDDINIVSEYAISDEEKEGIKNDIDYQLKMMLISITNL